MSVRLQELIRRGCEASGITILLESADKEHIHLLIICPSSLAPSKVMHYLKGQSSRLLQGEFPELKKDTGDSIYGPVVIIVSRYSDRKNHR